MNLPVFSLQLSEEQIAELPDNQRFLLQQIAARFERQPHPTPKFDPQLGRTDRQDQTAMDKATNAYGGIRSDFVVNRRLR